MSEAHRPPNAPYAVHSPSSISQVMSRLNTNQRMSKMDLMSADLSIVEAKPGKVGLMRQIRYLEAKAYLCRVMSRVSHSKPDPLFEGKNVSTGIHGYIFCGYRRTD